MDGTLACKSKCFLCKVAELFKQVLSGIWSDPLKVSSAETVCTATHDITVGSTELAPRLERGFLFVLRSNFLFIFSPCALVIFAFL